MPSEFFSRGDGIDPGYGRSKFQVRVDVIPGTPTKRRIVLLAHHPIAHAGYEVQVLLREPVAKWDTLPRYAVMPPLAGVLIDEPFDIVDLRRALTRYLLPVSSTSEHGKAIHRWFRDELAQAAHDWIGRQRVVLNPASLTPDQLLTMSKEEIARALTGQPQLTTQQMFEAMARATATKEGK